MPTAAQIKELRETTGAPMLKCREALTECNDNMEDAIAWLRKKSQDVAGKKAGRISAEGLIGLVSAEGKGVLCELNSETDFVAKNPQFIALLNNVTQTVAASGDAAVKNGDIDAIKALPCANSPRSVGEEITESISVIGENINLRRTAVVEASVVVPYLHNAVSDTAGKIGVLVAIETEGDKEAAAKFGKSVAMHIAAFKPKSLNVDGLDPALIEKEREILTEQARASGKPDNVIEKMIEGRIRKFYSEVVLLEQPFVMDNKQTVDQARREAEKEAGGSVTIAGYTCFVLGEGIEKKEENFAEETAKLASGG